jgi:hypothetical protein
VEPIVIATDEDGAIAAEAALLALGQRGLTRVLATGRLNAWATDDP